MKISLIELAKMENKPSKIILDNLIYEYSEESNEYSYYDGGHIIKFINEEIPFSNINKKIIEIVKEPILDEVEKEYLKAVIKPFRDKVEHIGKRIHYINKGVEEYIRITLKDDYDTVMLPYFKENTMYKGMKVNRCYELEELDI